MSDKTADNERQKVRLKTVIFDTDMVLDPKVRILLDEFGTGGLAMFIQATLSLARDGGRLSEGELSTAGGLIGVDKETFNAFLKRCADIELLIVTDGEYSSSRILRDIDNVMSKRTKWRVLKDTARNPAGVLDVSEQEQEEEHEVDLDLKKKTKNKGGEGGKPKPEKVEVAERVWLTKAETEKFIATYGEDYYNEAVEKLSNWIGMNPNADRVRNGKNAAYTFRSWVLRAVGEDRKKQVSNLNWLNTEIGDGSGSFEELLGISSNGEGTRQEPISAAIVATTAKRLI